jgi:hydrogenase small subunit
MDIADHSGQYPTDALGERRVSRREFLKFCTLVAGTLALPASMVPKVAYALQMAKRPPIVWLEYQDCAGCTESFLRANQPTAAELVLDIISVNYHETIMAPAGRQAEKSLEETVQEGGYIAVVEGAIPTKDDGVYCCVGGRTALDTLQEVAGNAVAVITVGACAFYGGWPATTPNPTEAKGVKDLISGVPIVNLPGCPMNVDNFTATVVHYLTFGALPAADDLGRPLFAYGRRIHDNCERRGHFDAGEFVREWGDEGHRKGWCLYQMGCKGPVALHNCPTIRWNEGTSWPVAAGHGCIACAAPDFWERGAYETVPILQVTPPTAYPEVVPGVDTASLATAAAGAAVGVAAGVMGTVAAQQVTKKEEEQGG